MATQKSPFPPSARRQTPAPGKAPAQSTGTPSGGKDTPPASHEKDDPHWAPESGDKLDGG